MVILAREAYEAARQRAFDLAGSPPGTREAEELIVLQLAIDEWEAAHGEDEDANPVP